MRAEQHDQHPVGPAEPGAEDALTGTPAASGEALGGVRVRAHRVRRRQRRRRQVEHDRPAHHRVLRGGRGASPAPRGCRARPWPRPAGRRSARRPQEWSSAASRSAVLSSSHCRTTRRRTPPPAGRSRSPRPGRGRARSRRRAVAAVGQRVRPQQRPVGPDRLGPSEGAADEDQDERGAAQREAHQGRTTHRLPPGDRQVIGPEREGPGPAWWSGANVVECRVRAGRL